MDIHILHKIMHGEGALQASTWFKLASLTSHATRSGADPLNIRVKTGRLELQRNFYSVRVINDWNRIPPNQKQTGDCQVQGGV